ncbi:DUF2877 domain-containing protein [Bacillus sp. DTU_2020_1000418_1_SI_GHA_SEK_038]|uniref:DUF2877 domain-containing protein n=1 Tax=Bacillus sp. DTU_2020_1000418_1_SI_GHA_SEK_038 TaxID=3077585 RepID=UPI0028EA5A3B|nr:DUF2877 domain-containing protein [Bacillus sp. DTU_2020_1000418_1_SI_GHA_SEK_038]WNS75868.1 DUF2877 domain-containing protein [Bacillus sp. DTU_2020_1000418_1_SI_GHA_SEK_038]
MANNKKLANNKTMNTNKIIWVEEYEKNIPLFLANNKVGTVHSVFNNGMNILMGNRLFFIGTVKNGKLPFGIHVHYEAVQEVLATIQMPAQVIWNEAEKQLSFENCPISVSFQQGKPYSNIVKSSQGHFQMSAEALQAFIATLTSSVENTGLEIDIAEFIIDYLSDRKDESPTVKAIYRLMEALHTANEAEAEAAVRYFLGRGRGLTPSGDDHLVGILAIHEVSHAFSPVFVNSLQTILKHESVTTDIAKEYLFYALNGQFSSSIVQIVNHLSSDEWNAGMVNKNLLELMTVGHSSGVDTAFGLLIGILSIKYWRKQ